jgi:hypothetical protein
MSGQSKLSARYLNLSSSERKLFHVDGAAGPILAYGFLFASIDQKMSFIRKIKTQIVMGQTRQTSDNLTKHEEQDRRAAGYIDEPKNESYLPSSVHGLPRHMKGVTSI